MSKVSTNIYLVTIILSICIIGCATYDNKCTSFIKNVDMEKMLSFSESSVWPYRSNTILINNYRIDKYDTSSIDKLKIIGDLNIRLNDLTKPEIHNLYRTYEKLGVPIIWGACQHLGYIQIVISPKLVVVYICNSQRFNLDKYLYSYSIEGNSIIKYDESWFYYKLPKERYYNIDP